LPSLCLLLFFVAFVLVCHFCAHSFKGYPSSCPHLLSFQLGRYSTGTRRPSSADADERSASGERQRKRGRRSRDSGPQIRDVSMECNYAERDPSPGGPIRLKLRFMSASTVADVVSLEPEKSMLVENPEEQQQVVPRSRWQAVLLEAGGIGAAVSEESMRRLKYCLQWLLVGRFVVVAQSRSGLTMRSTTVRNDTHRWPNRDSARLYRVPATATRFTTRT